MKKTAKNSVKSIQCAIFMFAICAFTSHAQHFVDLHPEKQNSRINYYVTLFANTAGIGHSFVAWEIEEKGKNPQITTLGFGPRPGEHTYLDVIIGVPGEVTENSNYYDKTHLKSVTFRVNSEEFATSRQQLPNWTEKTYRLGLSDCVGFIKEIGESIGLTMPSRIPINMYPEQYVNALIDSFTGDKYIQTTSGKNITITPDFGFIIGTSDDEDNFTGYILDYDEADGSTNLINYKKGKIYGPSWQMWEDGSSFYTDFSISPKIALYSEPGKFYINGFVPGENPYYGRINYSDGTVYEGNMKGTKPNGVGVKMYRDGNMIKANFVNGIAKSYFPVPMNNGHYYGWFSHGLMNGKGELRCHDGTKFIGNFSNGIMNGNMKVVCSDGSVYDATYRNGIMIHANISFRNGDKYSGPIINGLMSASGSYTFSSGVGGSYNPASRQVVINNGNQRKEPEHMGRMAEIERDTTKSKEQIKDKPTSKVEFGSETGDYAEKSINGKVVDRWKVDKDWSIPE